MALVADPTIPLGTWPSSTSCVCWSDDCEIAVAFPDHVDVLVPKFALSYLADKERKQEWQRVSLQSSAFTTPEWPMFDPRPWQIFSIGEEQSNSHVLSLAWSPAGLAKHSKCALAILTANRVLSIWASESDPKNERTWKRVLVVNHALQGVDEESDDGVLCSRIRSFCWGPPMEALQEIEVNHGRRVHVPIQTCVLAASTDLGDIAILQVCSPHQSIDQRVKSWSTRLIARHSVAVGPYASRITGDITADALAPRVVKHLAWSHSMSSAGDRSRPSYGSLLAYMIGSDLCVLPCKVNFSDQVDVSFAPQAERLDGLHKGPLGMRREPASNAATLVSFTGDGVVLYTLHDRDAGSLLVAKKSHSRDLYWETVSGLAFTSPDTLHATTLLSPNGSRHMSLVCSADTLAEDCQPQWARLLDQEKAKFGAENRIAHRVLGRIWGLGADPAGCCVAVYCSLHPSELPQFTMRVEQEGFLLLSLEVPRLNFSDHLTAESLLVAAKLRIDNSSTDGMQEYKAICEAMGNHKPTELPLPVDQYRASAAVRSLKDQARAIRTLTSLVPGLPQIGFGQTHINEYNTLLRVMSPVWRAIYFSDFDKANLSEVEKLILQNLRLGSKLDDQPGDDPSANDVSKSGQDDPVIEICGICSRPVKFENFLWARCEKGHPLERCILTLLVIQAAGISRHCSVCKRPALDASYLNKEVAKASDTAGRLRSDSPAQQRPLGLVDLLLAAFDTCICCGGKFSG